MPNLARGVGRLGVLAACVGALVLPATAAAAPPANDNQANATVLTGESPTATGTNVDATAAGGRERALRLQRHGNV